MSEISKAAIASYLKSITNGYIIPGSHCIARSGYNFVNDDTMKETCLSIVCSGSKGKGFVNYVK